MRDLKKPSGTPRGGGGPVLQDFFIIMTKRLSSVLVAKFINMYVLAHPTSTLFSSLSSPFYHHVMPIPSFLNRFFRDKGDEFCSLAYAKLEKPVRFMIFGVRKKQKVSKFPEWMRVGDRVPNSPTGQVLEARPDSPVLVDALSLCGRLHSHVISPT